MPAHHVMDFVGRIDCLLHPGAHLVLRPHLQVALISFCASSRDVESFIKSDLATLLHPTVSEPAPVAALQSGQRILENGCETKIFQLLADMCCKCSAELHSAVSQIFNLQHVAVNRALE